MTNQRSLAELTATIRRVLAEHGRLSCDATLIATEADLYQLGLTSHASVNIMLALEGEFEVEFPDYLLTRSMFASIDALAAALTPLLTE